MNRFSQISTSQFDPLSLQEVMSVPLYKQAKFDQLEADRIKQAEMFKVDPLDVHKDLALQLNRDYMSKVDELANYQTKTGDIQGAKSRLLDLQREYKKLNDPTGKVAQINFANKAYQDEKNRFLEAASKQYGSSRALELWNQNKQNYTGYNDKGEITNISPQGIVAAKDFDKELQQYHNLLGSTASAASSSGYKIVDSGQGDGSKVMVNQSGQVVKDDNIRQLNDMRKAMAADWLNPNGEGFRYNMEAGVDPVSFQNKFNNLINSQLKTKLENKTDINANYIAPPTGNTSKGKDNIGEFEKIPYGIENTSVSTDIADKINSIGGKSVGKALSYSYDVLTGKKPQAQTKSEFDKSRSQVFIKPEDVLKGGELSIYNNAKKYISKITPNFNKLSATEQNKLIADKASKDILTFSPIVIKPTVKSIGALIPSVQKGTDIKSIGNSMLDDAIGGARVLYDVITGEKIEQDDVKNNIKSMTLYGVTAPHNLRNQKMIGAQSNQKVSPIIATITDSEGKKSQVYVSRTGTELKSPEFAKIKSANDVFNGVINNVNTKVRITDKNSNLYGSSVTYDSSITDGYPIIITTPGGQPERISLDEFQNDAL